MENRCVDMAESGMNWEIRVYIYTLLCVKCIAKGNLPCSTGSSTQSSVVTWWAAAVGCDEREVREGESACLHMADSLCCRAETTQHCKATTPHFYKSLHLH